MSTFTIDSDNNITAHAGLPAGADESQSFSTAKELAKLAAEWPVTRMADTRLQIVEWRDARKAVPSPPPKCARPQPCGS